MSDLVPLICAQEQADIKAEISGEPVYVVVDGITRLGEAMAVVVNLLMTPLPYSNDSAARKKHDRRRDCA